MLFLSLFCLFALFSNSLSQTTNSKLQNNSLNTSSNQIISGSGVNSKKKLPINKIQQKPKAKTDSLKVIKDSNQVNTNQIPQNNLEITDTNSINHKNNDSNHVDSIIITNIDSTIIDSNISIEKAPTVTKNDTIPLAGKFLPTFTGLSKSTSHLDDLYGKDFDFPGARSEILTPSIAGNPGINHPFVASNNLQKRNIYGIGGYWMGVERDYDYSTLNLHGENGIINIKTKASILDTPLVDITWERGAFRENLFRLNFQRLITDSIMLQIYAETNSIDDEGEWSYASSTHQPFLSLFKRDSSLIPFTGRNLLVSTSHFIPALSFFNKTNTIHLFGSLYSNKTGDYNQYSPIVSDVDYTYSYVDDAYYPSVSDKSFGFDSEFFTKSKYSLKLNYIQSSVETKISETVAYLSISDAIRDSLNTPRDSLFSSDTTVADSILDSIVAFNDSILNLYDDIQNYNQYQKIYSGGISFVPNKNIWWPSAHFKWEYLQTPDYLSIKGIQIKSGGEEQDKQLAWLESAMQYKQLSYRFQGGMSRNSSALNQQSIDPALSAEIKYQHKYFEANAYATDQYRYPDYYQLHYFNTGRLYFPNQELGKERISRIKGEVKVKFGSFLTLGYRQKYEQIDNAMVPAWLATPIQEIIDTTSETTATGDTIFNTSTTYSETTSDTLAFSEMNASKATSSHYSLYAELSLGNWKFSLERGDYLSQSLQVGSRSYDNFPHLSNVFYKGKIYWSNILVENRLGVEIQFNWNWFGERTAYERSTDNSLNSKEAYKVEVPHYLALDFQALMKIQHFQLYGRIDNLNHSKYRPDIGYTPTGMTFRYGITWSLFN